MASNPRDERDAAKQSSSHLEQLIFECLERMEAEGRRRSKRCARPTPNTPRRCALACRRCTRPG